MEDTDYVDLPNSEIIKEENRREYYRSRKDEENTITFIMLFVGCILVYTLFCMYK